MTCFSRCPFTKVPWAEMLSLHISCPFVSKTWEIGARGTSVGAVSGYHCGDQQGGDQYNSNYKELQIAKSLRGGQARGVISDEEILYNATHRQMGQS